MWIDIISEKPPNNSYFKVKLRDGEEVNAKQFNGVLKVQGTGGVYWRPFGNPPEQWKEKE